MDTLQLVIGDKNYSSWSLRPWLVLKEANIEFQEILIPLKQPYSKAKILKISPSGKVPILLHHGLAIWESLAICEYLAEVFPEKMLWPVSPEARALARAISAEMHAGFIELRKELPMDCSTRYPGKTLSPQVMRDIERILMLWQDCFTRFAGSRPYLLGEFSIADAMFAPVATRFVTYGIALPAFAKEYVDTLYQLPSMQAWLGAAKQEIEVVV